MSDEEWRRPFSHYINLLFSDLVLRFLAWYQSNSPRGSEPISTQGREWERFEKTLALVPPTGDRTWTVAELAQMVEEAFIDFGLYVNNIADEEVQRPKLSVLGSALDALFDAVAVLPDFQGKTFYFLIDEYESFENYQQRIVNTLIKQSAGRPYCFKIGVRLLGWRIRHTLNNQELRDPSDYRRIDIAKKLVGKHFKAFALDVFNSRLSRLINGTREEPHMTLPKVRDLFPGLTIFEEAELLGVEQKARVILKESAPQSDAEKLTLKGLHPALIWFAVEWGKVQRQSPVESLKQLAESPKDWEYRFVNNYGYSSLFAIKKGKIRKHYAGWDVYLKLAAGNIRFLLQLVEEALREHIRRGCEFTTPIKPDAQTGAAWNIGLRNFEELEGIDVKGAKIMRLLLGIGRVFQIFAWDPFGHAPEINQFSISDSDSVVVESEVEQEALELLDASVNHLALQRAPATKLGREDPRGFDYWVHPIYSAFFQFSHRRKRKMTLSLAEIHRLVVDQKGATEVILGRHGRDTQQVKKLPLPTQLHLFFPPDESV